MRVKRTSTSTAESVDLANSTPGIQPLKCTSDIDIYIYIYMLTIHMRKMYADSGIKKSGVKRGLVTRLVSGP